MTPGCCHPTHAMRTKCACGRVLSLGGAFGNVVALCECGRKHRKESGPGGSFEPGFKKGADGGISTGQRRGGRAGCPGIGTPLADSVRDDGEAKR